MKIRIGTRGSKLALWQANYVKRQLEGLGHEVELVIIKTRGDRIQDLSFDKIEGKGFFTKELEEALLEGRVDLAVHSMKDLPTEHHPDLVLAGVSKRANPADWLIARPEAVEEGRPFRLKSQAVVGTSSARRKAQLRHFRPDVSFVDIRGNVPTRLRKLEEGQTDAIVLAAAGIERLELDLSHLHVQPLYPREFVPAPAQGVLAYQCRRDDTPLRKTLLAIHDEDTARTVQVERKVLQLTGGGCHAPLGAYCERDPNGFYHLFGAWASAWDQPVRFARQSASTTHLLAERLVEALKG